VERPTDPSFQFEVLNDEQINEVSGGAVPLGVAAAYVGLGLGGAGFGFSVGQAIWGD